MSGENSGWKDPKLIISSATSILVAIIGVIGLIIVANINHPANQPPPPANQPPPPPANQPPQSANIRAMGISLYQPYSNGPATFTIKFPSQNAFILSVPSWIYGILVALLSPPIVYFLVSVFLASFVVNIIRARYP